MRLHCLRRRTRLRQRPWHGNRGVYPPPRCLRTQPFPITPFGGAPRGAIPFPLFPNRHITLQPHFLHSTRKSSEQDEKVRRSSSPGGGWLFPRLCCPTP